MSTEFVVKFREFQSLIEILPKDVVEIRIFRRMSVLELREVV